MVLKLRLFLEQEALKDDSAMQVSCNFFGDGTANNGDLHINMLCIQLPATCTGQQLVYRRQLAAVHTYLNTLSENSECKAEEDQETLICFLHANSFSHFSGCGTFNRSAFSRNALWVCSAGQFYECLNMAALYKLPCIFVVENNKWAIGMNHPRATGPTLGDDEPYIYKKGPAFGMPGVLVDGMDVRKVRLCT